MPHDGKERLLDGEHGGKDAADKADDNELRIFETVSPRWRDTTHR